MRDLRHALRSLLRQPGYLLVTVVTLALGLGANVAIFSVFDSVVLRRLPWERPEELVRLRADRPFTAEEMEAFQEAASLRAVAGFTGQSFILTGDGDPEVIPVALASASYFDVFAGRLALGNAFRAEDQRAGAEGVVVLAHGLWRRRFGGDREILGRRIAMSGGGHPMRTVIGVMAEDFRPLDPRWQAWVPLQVDRSQQEYFGTAQLSLIARLRRGASLEEAKAQTAAVRARLLEGDATRRLDNFRLQALKEAIVGGTARTTLGTLLGASGLVLLIACANVTSVLLAWAERRRHEAAIRASLGAGRGRLLRLMLTESVLLAVAGGVAGLAVAWATLGLLVARLPASVPRAADVAIDARIFGFALSVALGCGLLVGLVPALRLSAGDLLADLRQGGMGATPARGGWHRILVAVEIALSLALAVGAGLTLKSLWQLNRIDPGFAPQRLLTFQPLPAQARYPEPAQRQAYFQEVMEGIAVLPGVESVAAAFPLPLTGEQLAMSYDVEDRPRDSQEQPPYAEYTAVTATYFRTLGIQLVDGRPFSDRDRAGSEEVGIVNQTLARRLWPNESAVGKRIRWLGNEWFKIVGVAADVKQSGLTSGSGDLVYRPWAQDAWLPTLYLAVRTTRKPTALVADIRKAVWAVDPQAPITSLQTMEERIAASQSDARFITLLLSLAAFVAMSLGVVGVYGVTALVVGRRRQELGIRLALGATRGMILGHALRREAAAIALGLAVGFAAAWIFGRVLSSLLFGVSPRDPVIFAVTSLLLAAAAGAAVWIPARRATGTDFHRLLRPA